MSTHIQRAMRDTYLCISYPYARSHGPAMFFISGCQSWDTASQVYLIITGPCCAMMESSGRYFAHNNSPNSETPVYVPELNSDKVLLRSKRSMMSWAYLRRVSA
jgi:hypothetical protein